MPEEIQALDALVDTEILHQGIRMRVDMIKSYSKRVCICELLDHNDYIKRLEHGKTVVERFVEVVYS